MPLRASGGGYDAAPPAGVRLRRLYSPRFASNPLQKTQKAGSSISSGSWSGWEVYTSPPRQRVHGNLQTMPISHPCPLTSLSPHRFLHGCVPFTRLWAHSAHLFCGGGGGTVSPWVQGVGGIRRGPGHLAVPPPPPKQMQIWQLARGLILYQPVAIEQSCVPSVHTFSC